MRKNYYFLMGVLCLLGSMILFGKNIWDDWKAQAASLAVSKSLYEKTDRTYQGRYKTNPEMEMPIKIIDGLAYIGRVKIDALALDLPVLSTWSYDKIQVAPARYRGSVYENNLMVLAHNYRSHFGKIHRLQKGDQVVFCDVDDNHFEYMVESKEILKAWDQDRLLSKKEGLSLITCTLGGQSRLVLRCKPIEHRE